MAGPPGIASARKSVFRCALLLLLALRAARSFGPASRDFRRPAEPVHRRRSRAPATTTTTTTIPPPTTGSSSSTALRVLLDVPEGFFTVTFPVLGILLSFSKSFARIRMEERAWEQRLADGRRKRLAQDPTLTELDLRRLEAAEEWSAYGKPRWEEEEQQQQQRSRSRYGGSAATAVGPAAAATTTSRTTDPDGRDVQMSDEEIARFESLYGIEYDPYYDDPYTEEELPAGKFTVDKRYGDRVYADGEVFYKTGEGMYYRQGAKPRNWKFW